jgi:hypothetical protein
MPGRCLPTPPSPTRLFPPGLPSPALAVVGGQQDLPASGHPDCPLEATSSRCVLMHAGRNGPRAKRHPLAPRVVGVCRCGSRCDRRPDHPDLPARPPGRLPPGLPSRRSGAAAWSSAGRRPAPSPVTTPPHGRGSRMTTAVSVERRAA